MGLGLHLIRHRKKRSMTFEEIRKGLQEGKSFERKFEDGYETLKPGRARNLFIHYVDGKITDALEVHLDFLEVIVEFGNEDTNEWKLIP
jgi:hypothetical protein